MVLFLVLVVVFFSILVDCHLDSDVEFGCWIQELDLGVWIQMLNSDVEFRCSGIKALHFWYNRHCITTCCSSCVKVGSVKWWQGDREREKKREREQISKLQASS